MDRLDVTTQLRDAAKAIANLTPSIDDTEAHYTARVAGFGLVNWTPERIDADANRLLRTHVPARRWFSRRASECRECATPWPCGFVTWADQWGRGVTRSHAHRP
jgi:hypothetical protein